METVQSTLMSEDARTRHREWLESLDPDVRVEVEAEIAFYKNEDLWEFEEVDDNDDDWAPPAEADTAAPAESDSVAAAD